MKNAAERERSITVQDASRRREMARQRPILLIVGNGQTLVPPSAERVVEFGKALHIGRHPPENPSGETWTVRDPLLSAEHCLIEKEAEGYRLTDLASRNGTAVDGLLVKGSTKLRDGSVIFAGSQVAVFRTASDAQIEAIRGELSEPLGPVATASPTCAALCAFLRKLAASTAEILLAGETGVGKEVYARAIHDASTRRHGPFVAINCAAVPRELVESELFGYARGAHSQAAESKRGLIELAESGTLLLDEVGEMPPELQTKLLRFLQDRSITPLGAVRPRHVDVRILAATSRTLSPSAKQPSLGLRPDLAARLGAEPVRIPPLRHRVEDIGAFAAYFLRRTPRKIEPLAFQALMLHNWPGNVRELEKTFANAAVLSEGEDTITLEHLPSAIMAGPTRIRSSPDGGSGRPPLPTPRELEELLARHDGNIAAVGRELGRTAPLIRRWCQRFKLDPDKYRSKS